MAGRTSFSNEEYADILFYYGAARGNAEQARREYGEVFPNRRLPDARVFSRTFRRVRERGTVVRYQGDAGRPRLGVRDDEEEILNYFQRDPTLSTRMIARRMGRSQWKITMGKVATAEAMRFMVDCLKAVGTAARAAEQQAELLIQADRFGHPSHGLNRLEMYVNDIISGACKPNNEPKVLKESPSTAWIDANNVLGATASHYAMDVAINKAKETGVAWVTVKGSNHNGMAGFWAQKAADKGLIGMAFTNTSPLLAPTRSKQSALGTNPISVVAPASQGESFYLDMATTAVAVGKIEMQRRKGEPLPAGWAQGPDGRETQDADLAFETGCLMPLGGGERTSGYKGFGLAAMVELFCGISAGANYGHHVRSWSHSGDGGPANLGHCFVAVDPECFAPGFGDRLAESIQHWRQLEPTDPDLPVLAPGDKEKKAAAEADVKGTVSYVKQQIESSAALAERLKVKPMEVEME